MGKVIKIFLNHGFTPIDTTVFKRGSCLSFDCYIQRFNGFAILIERGTLLSEAIYAKLTQRDLNIYVENKSYSLYQEYCSENLAKVDNSSTNTVTMGYEAIVLACNTLHKIIAKTDRMSEKLEVIYTHAKSLFDAWLREEEKQFIPVETIEILVEELVCVVNQEEVTLSSFNDFLDEKDSLSAHLVKVAFFASIVGSHIGIDMTDQKKLILAAMLHDIGKCDIEDDLLQKPSFLSDSEIKKIQKHAETSTHLVKRSGLRDRIVLNAIKEHHERLDGSGYPRGIDGSRISKFAKIIAICDMFDAMITIKPYRGAYSTYNALSLMYEESKHKLDADYTKVLIKHLR